MTLYYKPWLAGRTSKAPPPPDHPLDKIRCRNGHSRYVVACMSNCPQERYCPEFWEFFKRRGVLPTDFYNVDGIGDEAMRRIVIDCDRCGRKDLDDVYSLYRAEGEGDEFRLPEEEHRALIESCGYAWEEIGPFVLHTLERLEAERGWVHFCRRCFKQNTEWLAKICQVKPVPALKGASTARKKSANKAQGDAEAAAEPPLRVAKGGRRPRAKSAPPAKAAAAS